MNRSTLLTKREHYGVRGNAFKLIQSCQKQLVKVLSKRKQDVQEGNTKSSFKVNYFLGPQGSILGPLFFLLFINDLNSSFMKTDGVFRL